MPLKKLNKFRYTLRDTMAFRLTLWSAGIFTVSALGIFFILYFITTSILSKHQDQALFNEISEYSSFLSLKGLETLGTALTLEAESEGVGKCFFRIISLQGEVIFSSNMSAWDNMGISDNTLEKLQNGADYLFETKINAASGHKVRVLYGIIGSDKVLQIGESLEDYELFIALFRNIFFILMPVMIILAALAGWFMAKRAMHGVLEVTRTAVKISKGAFEQRVYAKTKGYEIEQLVMAFNAMLDYIDKLVSGMKDVTDNIAHDLRTPLTRMRGNAEMILSDGGHSPESENIAGNTIEECDRLLEMINTILDISEAETGIMKLNKDSVDISSLIYKVVDIYKYVAEEKKIIFHINVPDRLYVYADSIRISQALANLLDNALKYSFKEKDVYFNAFQKDNQICISIKDSGPGIPEKELSRIWDRLYRGDQSRSQKGLGLGLSLVKAIVKAHNGRVFVLSTEGKGSEFTICLPLDKRDKKIAS